jgi:nucleotide-binding universal stress UspA family protein
LGGNCAAVLNYLRKKRTDLSNRCEANFVRSHQNAAMKAETIPAGQARKLQKRVSNGSSNGHAPIAIKKILAPTDFSPASEKGLKYALRFAREFGAEVTLLHILEPIAPFAFEGLPMRLPVEETGWSDAARALKALEVSARQKGVSTVRAMTRQGIASHEIVDAAKEFDIDLIVMATHGYTGLKHFCIGSTAERVVRAAPCPVLVVREKEHEFC